MGPAGLMRHLRHRVTHPEAEQLPSRQLCRGTPQQQATPALENDQPISGGRPTAVERAENLARFERERRPEGLPMDGKNLPVVARVGHHKHEDVESRVPFLEDESSDKCLEILELRLGFEANPVSTQLRLGIDRSSVPWNGERYL